MTARSRRAGPKSRTAVRRFVFCMCDSFALRALKARPCVKFVAYLA